MEKEKLVKKVKKKKKFYLPTYPNFFEDVTQTQTHIHIGYYEINNSGVGIKLKGLENFFKITIIMD